MKKPAVFLLFTVTLLLSPALEAQTPLNQKPSRVVGQNSVDAIDKSIAPNVVEGREFAQPWAVAVDSSSSPAPLYVSDQSNNRILGWRNAASFRNGQAADLVIGQVDFLTTQGAGPGTARSAGMNSPNAIAVDPKGNLYVADDGNNRILRFSKPFASTAPLQIPDMVIGQSSLSTNSPNSGGLSASSISLASGSTGLSTGLAFDQQGNLWFSDSGNNRVLRYNAADLARGDNKPSADLELGQASFTTNVLPPLDGTTALNKSVLRQPSGLTFDQQGRLYVVDSINRVLVFLPPFSNSMSAARIMGIPEITITNGQATSPSISAYALLAPESVVMVGNNPAVIDRGNNRILVYDPFDRWTPETPIPAPAGTTLITVSPAAKFVIGQPDFVSRQVNRGLPEANETSLLLPSNAVTYNNEIFVVDAGNNRVLVYPTSAASGLGTAAATRVLGQDTFFGVAPNLLEGKELWLFNSFGQNGNIGPGNSDGAGLAIDNVSGTPHLYIADTFNNRILAYKDSRVVRPGDRADLVIGQVDFQRSVVNWPSGKTDRPSDQGLYHPAGLAVDANGDLWVADSGNARVLRFANPFNQNLISGQRANLVLGQTNFNARFTDPTPFSMLWPYGVAFTAAGDLLVSDSGHNRVLYFKKPAEGFRLQEGADKVIGQPDLFTIQGSNATPNRFGQPRGIAIDTDDRLYVADANANRIVIYDRIGAAGNDPSPAITLGNVQSPQGVYVSPFTGEIWATNSRGNQALRFPRFDRLPISSNPEFSVPVSGPLAIAQDAFGTLFVAEATNRVSIFYSQVTATNGASFNDTRPLSPGEIVSLFPPAGSTLVFTNNKTDNAGAAPLPFTLADTSVTVNGTPAALYFVGPNQINFVVPYSTPTSGTAEVQVTRPSTGQIISVFTFQLAAQAPGLFYTNRPAGVVAALNDDGTVNGPDHPIAFGHFLQIFATGGGPVSGAPPEGQAATTATPTDLHPDVLLGTAFLDPKNITYSGLAPGYPGMWQINIKIPTDSVAPGPNDLVVRVNSVPSNLGPNNVRLPSVIYVKQ